MCIKGDNSKTVLELFSLSIFSTFKFMHTVLDTVRIYNVFQCLIVLCYYTVRVEYLTRINMLEEADVDTCVMMRLHSYSRNN